MVVRLRCEESSAGAQSNLAVAHSHLRWRKVGTQSHVSGLRLLGSCCRPMEQFPICSELDTITDSAMDRSDYPHLSRLADNEELWTAFHDFDRILSNSRQRLPGVDTATEIIDVGRELHALAFEHFHLILVFRSKIKELARGTLSALSDENHVVLFNLARAFMEHTSSLAYQDQALQKAISDISSKHNATKIKNSIAIHRNVTRCLYYGGQGSPVEVARIHVNDLLKALGKVYENASSHYDSLCEFVHPNYGSNTLVSSGDLASGRIGIPSDLLLPEIRLAGDVIERCAEIVFELVFNGTRCLAKIDNWITIAGRSDAKISQLFSLRSAHTGDGKTKDTAIFFNKARTHQESIEAFYKYLEDEGLEMLKRQMAAIESGFLFELVVTSSRHLWVKYKMPR